MNVKGSRNPMRKKKWLIPTDPTAAREVWTKGQHRQANDEKIRVIEMVYHTSQDLR